MTEQLHAARPDAAAATGAKARSPLSEIAYDTNRRSALGRLPAFAAGTIAALVAACSSDRIMGTSAAVVSLPLTSDTDILKFALFLEMLEATFYTKAVASGVLSGSVAALAASIKAHETAHVAALSGALGADAFTSNDVSFDFGDTLQSTNSFLATAQVLEQTGVGAYLGALGSLQSRALRTTAGSIFTIEARHYAAIRAYTNASGGPVPAAFETPHTPSEVVSAVVATGFVTKGLG